MCSQEEGGHGRGGEKEEGGGGLPCCPHQREGQMAGDLVTNIPSEIDMTVMKVEAFIATILIGIYYVVFRLLMIICKKILRCNFVIIQLDSFQVHPFIVQLNYTKIRTKFGLVCSKKSELGPKLRKFGPNWGHWYWF